MPTALLCMFLPEVALAIPHRCLDITRDDSELLPRPSIFGSCLPVYRHCCEARVVRPTTPAVAAAPPTLLVDVELVLLALRIDSRSPPTCITDTENETSVDISDSSIGDTTCP